MRFFKIFFGFVFSVLAMSAAVPKVQRLEEKSAMVVMNEKTTSQLDTARANELMAHAKGSYGAYGLPQAPAVIQTSYAGNNVLVSFFTTRTLAVGSQVSFQMRLGEYTVVPFSGMTINFEGTYCAWLWDGSFPMFLAANTAVFEAVIWEPGMGISYVSAEVSTHGWPILGEQLRKVSIADDGVTNISGQFGSDVLVTIDGMWVPLMMGTFSGNGDGYAQVDLGNFKGERRMCVSSRGVSVTRTIYRN